MPDRRLVIVALILSLAGCLPGLGIFGAPVTGKTAPSGADGSVIDASSGNSTAGGNSVRPKGPVYGTVLDGQGRPVANVTVSAYLNNASPLNGANPLIGNSGAGLVGNTGGALVSNSGGAYRVQDAPPQGAISVKTDAGGHFVLKPTKAGKLNLEAVVSDDSKAWKSSIEFKGGDDQADAGAMRMAPTGSISGRVRSSEPSVSDFRNTIVYIPGSGYQAVTGADGTYTIPHVPVGEFELGAFNVDLGDAHLPDTDNPGLVAVESGKQTAAPALVMAVHLPVLAGVLKTGTSEATDNGGAGAAVDLSGQYFGYNRGTRFQVLFNGVPATTVKRQSETLIAATIPAGAQNGNLVVQVGNLNSNPLPFRVFKTVSLSCPNSADSYSPSSILDFSKRLTVTDTDGAAIIAVPDGNPPRHGPNVTWTVDSNFGSITRDGIFTALSAGPVNVRLQAGANPYTCGVTIVGPGTITLTPTPGPTPVPPTPTPVPPTPTPVPPTPTPYPPPTLDIDASVYEGIAAPIRITVKDASKASAAGGATTSIQVQVTSAAEPAGETVTLAESSAGSGIFGGVIWFERVFAESGSAQVTADDGRIAIYAEGGVVNDAVTVGYRSLTRQATYTEPASTVTGIVRVAGVARGGALVELRATGFTTRSTTSRSDGSYAFHDVPPGGYVIVAQVRGSAIYTTSVIVP